MAIQIRPTSGGAAKLLATINADSNLKLLYIRLGQGHRTTTGSETRLLTAFTPDKRFPLAQAVSYDDNTLSVSAEDSSSESYTFSEIGLFDEDGDLMAYRAVPSGSLSSKSTDAAAVFAVTIQLTAEELSVVEFATSVVRSATETRAGVVRLATADEMATGTSTTLAASVKTISDRVRTALQPVLTDTVDLNNLVTTGY